LLKAVFRQADCINTCTEDQKRKVMSLGTTPDKIRVLTLGVDTGKYSFKDRPPFNHSQKLKLVTTRRLEQVYNHHTIVEALAVLQSKNVDFQMTFVAGGSLLEKLKHQVEKAGLNNRVRFLGGVDKKEVVNILHRHDIFLSAPYRDGISVALLEAMATGLFPIVSDIEVNADWIEHGVSGLLHKVGDADQLANFILEIRGNPELAVTAAHYNRKKVVELADTRTNMKVLEGIYQEFIQER
jgi:glycosyltransferase involved in cell wall biosynthesis